MATIKYQGIVSPFGYFCHSNKPWLITGPNYSAEYPQENTDVSFIWEVVESVHSIPSEYLWGFHIMACKLARILSELKKS